jgi:endonuclease-3 related protein
MTIPVPSQRRRLLTGLFDALERAMGPTGWWPAETPFEVCIGAILTQNAPWTGVVTSIDCLKRAELFGPETIADAEPELLAPLIRSSIYHNQKARRLKSFCRYIVENWGGTIENMASLDLYDARERLLAQPGIGFETADSILLYALHKPIFVIDAYTKRILMRHGLAVGSWGYEEYRAFFEYSLAPDPDYYGEFHALLCLLGAGICRRIPRCAECPAHAILGDPLL